MLITSYTVAVEGITVPYPAKRGANRNNWGFLDTRGRPDYAARIPELSHSHALKTLVLALSAMDSAYFSLGCDVGSHQDEDSPPCVSGGYVQIAAAQFDRFSAEGYLRLARFIGSFVESRSSDFLWTLNLECTAVRFLLSGYDEIFPSVQIWFYARAATAHLAEESREALITAISEGIHQCHPAHTS